MQYFFVIGKQNEMLPEAARCRRRILWSRICFYKVDEQNSELLTAKRGITKMIDSLALAGADRKQQSRGGHRKNGKNDIG